jgi:hypothetical protein
MPIGALIVGSFAEHMGEPAALIINSTILILVTVLVFFAVPKLKSMP